MNSTEKNLLEKDKHVVLTDGGIDQWGLFFEALEVRNGQVTHQVRVFLCGKTVCHYILPADQSRTVWRMTVKDTPEAAEKLAVDMITKNRVVRGAPLLVQLTSADAEHASTGQMPGARYRGQYAIEKIYGKFKETPLSRDQINVQTVTSNLEKCLVERATAPSSGEAPARWADDPDDPAPVI